MGCSSSKLSKGQHQDLQEIYGLKPLTQVNTEMLNTIVKIQNISAFAHNTRTSLDIHNTPHSHTTPRSVSHSEEAKDEPSFYA